MQAWTTSSKSAWEEEEDEEEEKGDESARHVPMVERTWLGIVMGVIVSINLVTLGFETDFRHDSWPAFFAAINSFFLLAYVSEIALRTHTYGFAILSDKLSLMEMILVLGPFIERLGGESGFVRSLVAFRSLRTAKRLTTSTHFKGSRILPVLLAVGVNGLVAMFWAIILLLPIVVVMACYSKRVIGESPVWAGSTDPLGDQDGYIEPFSAFEPHEYFGTVRRSSLTLVQVLTEAQWGDMGRRILERYPVMFLFFLFFNLLTRNGILSSLIGVVYQVSKDETIVSAEAYDKVRKEDRHVLGARLLKIFAFLDLDNDGKLTLAEVEQGLRDRDVKIILRDLDLPPLNAQQIVQLGDIRGENMLYYTDFIEYAVDIDDELQTRDYVRLLMWTSNLAQRASHMEAKVKKLAAQTIEIRKVMQHAFEAVSYFQHTKEITQLKNRAVRQVRKAAPDDPPKIRGFKPPKEAKYPPEDQTKVFLGMANRLLGEPPLTIEERHPRPPTQDQGRHPEAPPESPTHGSPVRARRRGDIGEAPASNAAFPGDDPMADDQYWCTLGQHGPFPGPSPALQHFKRNLNLADFSKEVPKRHTTVPEPPPLPGAMGEAPAHWALDVLT